MGKERCKINGSKTYILKFDMHCQCNGCIKKINDGVKEIILSEVTKKSVEIVTQSTLSEGHIAPPQQNKNLYDQAPSDWFAPEARAPSASSGRRDGASAYPVIPSAPPLPEEEAWSETTVPWERCWYRWSAPSGSFGMWAASDITGTLAMYEL